MMLPGLVSGSEHGQELEGEEYARNLYLVEA